MTALRADPELPWGCWLRIEGRSSPAYVDDDTGGRWPTLREAFWSGRLSMPAADGRTREATLGLVHVVLAAAVRRPTSASELCADLFGGNKLFMRSFLLWLGREGLVFLRDADGVAEEPTNEGRAVLLMLSATRAHDLRGRRPSTATIEEIARFGQEPDVEAAFRRIEGEACRWDAAFLRREEAFRPSIILSKRAKGPLPVLTTVWSLPFDGASQRDRVYAWLCHRLDRWRDWAELAGEFGVERLTHIPMPAAEFETNYEKWAVENRGVKWNAQYFHSTRHSPDKISFQFDTAWDFPWPVFAALADESPDVVFYVGTEEGSAAFAYAGHLNGPDDFGPTEPLADDDPDEEGNAEEER